MIPMKEFALALVLSLLSALSTSEPISRWPKVGVVEDIDLLRRADTNWTTQEFQTHCNNIDYTYFSDCCTAESGPGWRSCNDVGTWSLSGSTILCYNLDAGHDCGSDNTVCDSGLGCCGNSCCQNSASVTVCEDGCVLKNGLGCVAGSYGGAGTCAHGLSVSTASSSTSSSTSIKTTYSTAKTSTTSTADAPANSSPSSTSANTPEKSKVSTGGIIGIAVYVGCSVIGLVITAVVKILSYKKKQKREKEKAALEQAEIRKSRTGSSPSAPTSPAPWYPYSN
ncbi:uncharacterized protein PAC_01544 [Phialocephala subalpina]|uniref:Mid2 domain-containing protein n=1 Tax=Phialocephala subalpina TaxID=576137 RepID=A0A1L7WFY2_9HELO|nr:uncharacterized protein PAC_01544 [Phialocephala subalpina]